MTDRHAGYIVVLEKDVREDDAERIITALRQVRGVVDVTPVLGDINVSLAEVRAMSKFTEAMVETIQRLRSGRE